ncbi:MAG: type II secretion system minor pseudopilin GspH [Psychromonas sp.]|nr:type II secretion system minor pseudopilin GspH [Psychromonas sp.]
MLNKQLTCKQQESGFTLLEIMLVFLLIGMISVGVVMTLPNHLTSQEDVHWQAQRFRTLLLLAEDEALISGLELGVVFDENSYQFAFYDYAAKKWLPVVNKSLHDKVKLPDTLKMDYLLSGSVWDELDTEKQDDFINDEDLVHIKGEMQLVSLKPQVYVMSSGEVTPFSVEFSALESRSEQQAVSVSVSMNGVATLSE